MRAAIVAILCSFGLVFACGRTVPGESQYRQAVGDCEAGSNCSCDNCDDGDACTNDSCVDGACSYEYKNCDDNNACTSDSCSNGSCRNEQMDCGCDYKCQGGFCVADSEGEPDRCRSGSALVPPCSVVDAHNENMKDVLGKTFVDIDRFTFQCFGHYQKKYETKSVAENVGTVAETTVSGIKLGAGFENKPLMKKCADQCELRGFKIIKNLNVRNVVDCTGKALSAIGAVFNVITTLTDINDDSCLVQVRYHRPKMSIVEGPPCPTDCTENTMHTCSECGAEEPDLRRTSFKTLATQQAGFFQHDVMYRGACNADWVSKDYCDDRPNDDGWCMRAYCGSGPYTYSWIGPSECWNIVCAYEAGRRYACSSMADDVCDDLTPPEPKLTCADFGAECGSIVNDKGETVNCGSCPSGKHCENNKCIKNCPPAVQASPGANCDPSQYLIVDACGGGYALDCRWDGDRYSWQPSDKCDYGQVCRTYSIPGSDTCFTGCK